MSIGQQTVQRRDAAALQARRVKLTHAAVMDSRMLPDGVDDGSESDAR
jgi:hypothetical protein